MEKTFYVGIGVFSNTMGRVYKTFKIPEATKTIQALDVFARSKWVEVRDFYKECPFSLELVYQVDGKGGKLFAFGNPSGPYFSGTYEKNDLFALDSENLPNFLKKDEIKKLLT